MLKLADYDIVFQEVPGEVTLALNLSLCPNGCSGCHSPQLAGDIGTELTAAVLEDLMAKYGQAITCVCLMGGDNDPRAVEATLSYLKATTPHKTAWYSGKEHLPADFPLQLLDYLKTGPYVQSCGPLNSPTTNQRFYRIDADGKQEDITACFQRQ